MARLTDERVEQLISVLLFSGVILAAAVVLAGGACYLARHGAEATSYHVFHATAAAYRSVSGVIHALSASNCRAVIQIGLLILIATPIARVAFALVSFGFERDWTYVWVSSIVLAVLIYSFVFEH
jgi:uncharacterized membrane protein